MLFKHSLARLFGTFLGSIMTKRIRAARPLLCNVMPELSEEITNLLIKEGNKSLAKQVSTLEIYARCRCNDDFCSTFYTAPPPTLSWGKGHYNIALDPESGYIILDVVVDKIVSVEVLYRDEIRKKLHEIVG